jgi:hypothetical protein
VDAFLVIMKRFGLTPRAPVAPELLTNPGARRSMVETKHAIVFTFQDLNDPFWHVDVFLREDLGYESLRVESETIDLEGRSVRILSRRKLLELKLAVVPPRAKDQLDIAELRRLIQETQS